MKEARASAAAARRGQSYGAVRKKRVCGRSAGNLSLGDPLIEVLRWKLTARSSPLEVNRQEILRWKFTSGSSPLEVNR